MRDFQLDIELCDAGALDVLHIWRQLLLNRTPSTAVPLHNLHTTPDVTAIDESVLDF